MYVTLDLDDTLIHTQRDYDGAIERFADRTSARDDVDAEPAAVAERLNEIDYENLGEFGLAPERFPTSFERTLAEFADDPSEEARKEARNLGRSAYLSAEAYGERGFRKGADDLLDALGDRGAERHLLTAGDPDIQERKIEGLGLRDRVEGVSVVGMSEKADVLERVDENVDEPVVHVGNSASSDVAAARAAGVTAVYVPEGEWRGGSVDPDAEDVHVFDDVEAFVEGIDEVVAAVEGESESEGQGGVGV